MDIRRRIKVKRFWIFGILLGICVTAASLYYFFQAEKKEAENRMVKTVNYVKVQCSTYTHYNEASESKSLLRAIESARQMSTNIDMEVKNRNRKRLPVKPGVSERKSADPLGGWYPCAGCRGKDSLQIQHG